MMKFLQVTGAVVHAVVVYKRCEMRLTEGEKKNTLIAIGGFALYFSLVGVRETNMLAVFMAIVFWTVCLIAYIVMED